MKKYVFIAFVLFTSFVFACPKVDKVKDFVKKKILELVDGKSRDLSYSENQEEAEALLEVYEYIEKIEENPLHE